MKWSSESKGVGGSAQFTVEEAGINSTEARASFVFCLGLTSGLFRRGRKDKLLEIVPISFAEAKEFIRRHHRHHKPPVGHKFSIGCANGKEVVGVAVIGRPVARMLDDTWTLEVTRLCTDGTKNACSILYATAWRAARALGYRRLITYILKDEKGTSLIAAGWRCVGKCGGGSWNRKDRLRIDKHPLQMKLRFEIGVRKEG